MDGARDVPAFVEVAHGEVEEECTWDEGESAGDVEDGVAEVTPHKPKSSQSQAMHCLVSTLTNSRTVNSLP